MATRRVSVGDPAPDFRLPRQDGTEFHLGDILGRRPVILYFYPRDDTPGCTAEACGFRDRHAVFAEADAEVVGVSRDSVESHLRFAAKYGLPFTLLSDPDGRVHRLYGVPRAMLGLLPGRVTYVIDRAGIVRTVFGAIVPNGHVATAVRALENRDAP